MADYHIDRSRQNCLQYLGPKTSGHGDGFIRVVINVRHQVKVSPSYLIYVVKIPWSNQRDLINV